MAEPTNADQIAYWNGPGGQRWADRQAAQDILLKPIADLLIDRAKPLPGERVIDVGCGSGATTIAFGQKVAPSGHVFGIDVSGPMLERARQTVPKDLPIEFALADATVHPFDPASFDLLASRFGVMFIADPVLSFANLRKALRPDGRLAFVCWRPLPLNEWMMLPMRAALPHMAASPPPPMLDPLAPGPFAFADPDRVRGILGDAGFSAVTIDAHDALIGGNDLEETISLSLRVGPLGMMLRENPDSRDAVIASLRDALEPHAGPSGVFLPAAVWIVTARA